MDNNVYFVKNIGFCRKSICEESVVLLPIKICEMKNNTVVVVDKPFIAKDPNGDLIVVKRLLIVNYKVEIVINSFVSFPIEFCQICTEQELTTNQPTIEDFKKG